MIVHPHLDVTGYVGEWSVMAGDTITLHTSCESPTYEVTLERVRHGDTNPAGPGFISERVNSEIDGVRAGQRQTLEIGSCVVGANISLIKSPISIGLWTWPTTPALGREQVLAGWRDDLSDDGFAVVLAEDGELSLRWGDGRGPSKVVKSGLRLRRRAWFYILVTVDDRAVTVHLRPRENLPGDPAHGSASGEIGAFASDAPFVVAASKRGGGYGSHFNGKIEQPTIWSEALAEAELAAAMEGGVPNGEFMRWDFSHDQAGATAIDASGNNRIGVVRNAPMRAVTGWRWTGNTDRFLDSPEQYGAIWFHDDDLDDAEWAVDVEFSVPSDLASGIYAFHLKTDNAAPSEDYVPFVVRPRVPRREAVALLLPTLTYLAYANEHAISRLNRIARVDLSLEDYLESGSNYEKAAFLYILQNRLNSIYDNHSDGSGVAYSSRRRPVMNFRPRYGKPGLRFKYPHGLSCDLYLIDWMTELGFAFECITDEDLHREGASLLQNYRALMTGSHPEYWTSSMIEGLDTWLDTGGRLLYMGGNGFYWATSIDPQRPWLLEQRRGLFGSRPWTSEPGECYHSTTGEIGGLWRHRGRAPQVRVGVGFSAQGGDGQARPYRRMKASYDPRVSFIFDDVDDEIIGDFGLHMGGAAGWELDRADYELGTPPHALVLASSFDHSDAYHHAIEEELTSGAATGGQTNPYVRADMTYFEGPSGGAVFSTGSISWAGSLSHNAYSNPVSRITGNVLRRFLDPEPIPLPPTEAYSA